MVQFYIHPCMLNSTSKQNGHPDWSLWNRSKEFEALKSVFIQEQNPVSNETLGDGDEREGRYWELWGSLDCLSSGTG